jgi:hypothetical protein
MYCRSSIRNIIIFFNSAAVRICAFFALASCYTVCANRYFGIQNYLSNQRQVGVLQLLERMCTISAEYFLEKIGRLYGKSRYR